MIALAALVAALLGPATGRAAAAADSIRSEHDVRLSALRRAGEVRRCYEREGLARNPSLTGTVDVELTIMPTGRVSRVGVRGVALSGRGADEVSDCIAAAARNWRFARGPFVVERVVFPFQLSPELPSAGARVATSGS